MLTAAPSPPLSPYPSTNSNKQSDNPNFGYNAATGKFEDLMAGGIIDPAKVGGLALRVTSSKS